jgi:hypothetical protein
MDDLLNGIVGKETLEMAANAKLFRGRPTAGDVTWLDASVRPPPRRCLVHEETMASLEVTVSSGRGTSVSANVGEPLTRGGRRVLDRLLLKPTSDIATIFRRTNAIRGLEGLTRPIQAELRACLSTVADCEEVALWALQDAGPDEQALLDTVYFRTMDFLNSSEMALYLTNLNRMVLTPALSVAAPVLQFAAAYLAFCVAHGSAVSPAQFARTILGSMPAAQRAMGAVSMVMFCQGALTAIEAAKISTDVNSGLWQRMRSISRAQTAAHRIWTTVGAFVDPACFGMQAPQPSAPCGGFEGDFSVRCDIGRCLSSFAALDRACLRSCMAFAYLVDALLAVSDARKDRGLCWSELRPSQKPHVRAQGFWHPCLRSAVPNDVELGSSELPNNAIITGPNAGGKSTALKALCINVLLSQTLGVAAASRFAITPFSAINVQMNVPDEKGFESLFEAEMHRCLRAIRAQDVAKGFTLNAMDELFSSTEPTEGAAAAYAVAKRLGRSPDAINVICTHYAFLTSLASEADFELFRMTVARDEKGGIVFPYRLEPGASTQHVALELLEAKGFDARTVKDALAARLRIQAAR